MLRGCQEVLGIGPQFSCRQYPGCLLKYFPAEGGHGFLGGSAGGFDKFVVVGREVEVECFACECGFVAFAQRSELFERGLGGGGDAYFHFVV